MVMTKKKKGWFSLLKRLFVSDSKTEKKEKRRRWFFGRLKVKRLASITAPPVVEEDAVVVEEQSRRALNVAIATAAAAEAAIEAARVAAEVVRLTDESRCVTKRVNEPDCNTEVEIRVDVQSSCKEILELSAIRIQTAFRGYLAKKALRALKGIVRLQAIIRGRNVRRQAITTLKCLQSIVSIQSQVCAKRVQIGNQSGENLNLCHSSSTKKLQTLRENLMKMDLNGQRRWDDSVLTKEEAAAMSNSKKEAIMKRERIKEYAFNHRKSADSEQNKASGRWRYWLEQWVDTQLSKSKELEDLDTIWTPSRKNRIEYRGKDPKPIPGRSYSSSNHRKQSSFGEEKLFPSSPVVPAYMAATESAKAKARSASSPKLRTGEMETCSESYSPYKHKLSVITGEGRMISSRPGVYQQRSPSLKSAVRSSRTSVKDLSINSECSLMNWDSYR